MWHQGSLHAAKLFPIIRCFIKPETTMMSDECKAYNAITNLGMAHQMVNHFLNFLDPLKRFMGRI